MYPSYLIHYNKNHSKTNGQFISGDGDGDGVANDHAQRSERPLRTRAQSRKTRNSGIAMLGAGAGLAGLGKITSGVADITDNHVAAGIAMVTTYASIPLVAVGTVRTIKGAVDMGKASRRGDKS